MIYKILTGKVIKKSSDKTIKVETFHWTILGKFRHYQKVFKKIMVHDEKNLSEIGQIVKFIECKRLSKNKHFKLVE